MKTFRNRFSAPRHFVWVPAIPSGFDDQTWQALYFVLLLLITVYVFGRFFLKWK